MHPTSTRQAFSPLHRALLIAIAATLVATPASPQYLDVPTFGATTPPGWRSTSSDVAVGRDGSVILVWDQFEEGDTGPLPRELGIQRFTTQGVALGPAVRMPVSARVSDTAPRIVGDETGGYLLTWTGGQVGTNVTPMGRRLDASGTPVGNAFQVDLSTRNQGTGNGNAIAALPASQVIVWFDGGPGDGVLSRRFDHLGIQLQAPVPVGGASGQPRIGALATPDGGFVVAFGSNTTAARAFDNVGLPRGDAFVISPDAGFMALAANRAGDEFAAVMMRPPGYILAPQIWLRRFTRDGVLVGPEVLVHDAGPDTRVLPSVGFDANSNLIVTWAEANASGTRFRARGLDPTGTPVGPAVTLQTQSGAPLDVRTVRLADGMRFLSTWPRDAATAIAANVISLCTPGTSVCGDGARHDLCEICDAGAANSDTTPDACRTDCRPAHCGDGTIDTAEDCDDGNSDDCDGCSATCSAETGLPCGDGIPFPGCGQSCDDGNVIDRDGCSATCELERIPGDGTPTTDCYAEWSVNNPANEPYLDKRGAVSGTQVCVDDDPRCDFDGGVPGSCTFHIAVCANNTDLPRCEPGTRLASWSITTPSATKATRDPAAAALRAALAGAVLPAIVGPSAANVCSPMAPVTIPLRGGSGGFGARKVTLKTRATLYDGAKDGDTLRLICLPGS